MLKELIFSPTLIQTRYKHKDMLPRPIPTHLSIQNSWSVPLGRAGKCKSGSHGGKKCNMCFSPNVFIRFSNLGQSNAKLQMVRRKQVLLSRPNTEVFSVILLTQPRPSVCCCKTPKQKDKSSVPQSPRLHPAIPTLWVCTLWCLT